MMISRVIALIFLIIQSPVLAYSTGEPVIDEWYFGYEGFQNATIVVQSKIPCAGRIGQYEFDITPPAVTVKSIASPAGEYPLSFQCNSGSYVTAGLRVAIYINGVRNPPETMWIGNYSPSTSYAKNITNSCHSSWSAGQNSAFVAAGGFLTATSIWPCPLTPTETAFLFLPVTFPNKSPSARKVTLVVAGDDEIPSGNLGPFSFNSGTTFQQVMTYKIYLEPGVYPFLTVLLDTGYNHGFIASIFLDDILITKTGDQGWTSLLLEDGRPRLSFLNASMCSTKPVNVWGNSIDEQFITQIGFMPSWIWPNPGPCDGGSPTIQRALFRYEIDIKPLNTNVIYRKIDFHFSADDLFMMRLSYGTPIAGSPRDSRENAYSYPMQVPAQFSLYLVPAVYPLRFSIANYLLYGWQNNNMHLQGVISSEGSIVDVTNPSNGKWANSARCSDQIIAQWTGNLLEVERPFANTSVQMLGVGSCDALPGLYDVYYTLTVMPFVSSSYSLRETRLSSSSSAENFVALSTMVSPSTSSASITRSPSASATRSPSASATRSPSASISSSPLESIMWSPSESVTSESWPLETEIADMSARSSTTRSMKTSKTSVLASAFTSSAKKDLLKLVVTLENVTKTRAGFLVVCISAAFLAIVLLTGFWCLTRKIAVTLKSSVIFSTKPGPTNETRSENAASSMSGITLAGDTSFSVSGATYVNSSVLNVLSIPAYLELSEETDFRVDSVYGKGGSAEVMLGTAFIPEISLYGTKIVVKRLDPFKILSASQRAAVMQEIAITNYFQTCRNFVRLLGYSQSPLSIILKLYPFGSLKEWIGKNPMWISKRLAMSFLKDIGEGLKLMHNSGFVHCDMKTGNVLIDVDPKTKFPFCVLCDFGISQIVDSKAVQVSAFVVTNRRGLSLFYAAPEIFVDFHLAMSNKMRHYSSDVYAYGVIGVEILNKGRLDF